MEKYDIYMMCCDVGVGYTRKGKVSGTDRGRDQR
jgi:hypothetical protein